KERGSHQQEQSCGRVGAPACGEAGDPFVLGSEVADVIDRVARATRQPEPEAPGNLALDLAGADGRVCARQLAQQAVVAFLVLLREDQVDAVLSLRQRTQ